MRALKLFVGEKKQVKSKKIQDLFDKIGSQRLLVVSNRLPVIIDCADGNWHIHPGTGGLVTALVPIMEKISGLWLGWPGSAEGIPYEQLLKDFNDNNSYNLKPVILSQEDVEKYYYGFSNETLWPLFHDLLSYCKFDKDDWEAYNRVNRKYAETIAESVRPDDFIWVHDYHLALTAYYLREMNIKHNLAFFLHTPFPSFDLLRRMPWRNQFIKGMMSYDLLGFQTLRDRRNFVNCVKSVMPAAKVNIKKRYTLISYDDRIIKVGNFPISIDFEEFNDLAKTKKAADEAWYFHEKFNAKRLILGVDRLDYTKGIPERFLAFERALEKYPDLQGQLTLFQLLIPSRTPVPEYKHLKKQLDTLVGRINGKFSNPGWAPIHYMFRALDRHKLIGAYKACEIALVTPLRDGMNLVAKEYCASSVDNNGVLILSEFAGAADRLKNGAIIVNPYDLEQTADAIYQAFTMDPSERKRRMSRMRSDIKRRDVHQWVKWFIESFRERKLPPSIEDIDISGDEQELEEINIQTEEQ
ncbi:MAG: trehalose-6-phosphate synthase [candidate division Zixibacteria bacterium]|nr:trehalose-6-phosphate synthase [candidate division Zixibacteria bacterium]